MMFLLKLGWIYIAAFVINAISISCWYYGVTNEMISKPSVKEWAKKNRFSYICVWLDGLMMLMLPFVMLAMITVWIMSL